MCRFYEINPVIQALGDDKSWDDQEDDWEGCCQDPDEDEEDNEKEWCD